MLKFFIKEKLYIKTKVKIGAWFYVTIAKKQFGLCYYNKHFKELLQGKLSTWGHFLNKPQTMSVYSMNNYIPVWIVGFPSVSVGSCWAVSIIFS